MFSCTFFFIVLFTSLAFSFILLTYSSVLSPHMFCKAAVSVRHQLRKICSREGRFTGKYYNASKKERQKTNVRNNNKKKLLLKANWHFYWHCYGCAIKKSEGRAQLCVSKATSKSMHCVFLVFLFHYFFCYPFFLKTKYLFHVSHISLMHCFTFTNEMQKLFFFFFFLFSVYFLFALFSL